MLQVLLSSPFEKSIILTMDGVGEWSTSTIAIGNKDKIDMKKEIKFPHSLGLYIQLLHII